MFEYELSFNTLNLKTKLNIINLNYLLKKQIKKFLRLKYEIITF